jgi:formylglycine-generating enzyme required for sulfatase activity
LRAQDSVVTVNVGELKIDMVWVEGGSFRMGNNETPKGVRLTYEASRPEHDVTVSSFYIARFEVTQGLWRMVMGDNPSKFSNNDSLPVESVSWEEAQRFVIMLSQLTGRRFRLPTEAEWEFAARGGTRGTASNPYPGGGRAILDHCGWYCINSKGTTHPVGRLLPNELGLYDMSGNVAEWCQDWMEAYTEASQSNPQGPKEGENKVLRGGHYNSVSAACTVYDRSWYLPSGKYENFGLRIAMDE